MRWGWRQAPLAWRTSPDMRECFLIHYPSLCIEGWRRWVRHGRVAQCNLWGSGQACVTTGCSGNGRTGRPWYLVKGRLLCSHRRSLLSVHPAWSYWQHWVLLEFWLWPGAYYVVGALPGLISSVGEPYRVMACHVYWCRWGTPGLWSR